MTFTNSKPSCKFALNIKYNPTKMFSFKYVKQSISVFFIYCNISQNN